MYIIFIDSYVYNVFVCPQSGSGMGPEDGYRYKTWSHVNGG